MRADLERAEHHLLDSAREGGATWTALGISRQGAERRLLRGQTSLDGSRDADAGRTGRRTTKQR